MNNATFRQLGLSCLVAATLGCAPSVLGGENDAAALQQKVMLCVACHGADGIGKSSLYPNLRGQKAAYLEQQLKNFRSGARKAPNMERMARPLSDEDIADIAAFFASLNPDMARSPDQAAAGER
jgi:cytochrome c553